MTTNNPINHSSSHSISHSAPYSANGEVDGAVPGTMSGRVATSSVEPTETFEETQQHWSAWIGGPTLVVGILAILWLLVSWEMAIVVLGIVSLVVFHELGHFIAAKRSGMKVTEFSVGLGPKLWSAKGTKTLYSIRAIPVGAFVRIPEMEFLRRSADENNAAEGNTAENSADEGNAAEDNASKNNTGKNNANGTNTNGTREKTIKLRKVSGGASRSVSRSASRSVSRNVSQGSFGARAFVAAAGPATHFLVALLFFFILYSFIGYEGVKYGFSNDSYIDTASSWYIDEVQESSPADRSGLISGDKVIAVNGDEVKNFGEFRDDYILPNPGKRIDMEVLRGDELLFLTATLGTTTSSGVEIGRLGIVSEYDVNPVNPVMGAIYSFRDLGITAKEIVVETAIVFSPSRVANFVSDTFTVDDKPSQVVDGVGSSSSGVTSPEPDNSDIQNRPVSLVGAAQLGEDIVGLGIVPILIFFIFINILIGLFNLLPILPFDGGHVAIAIYEKIRSRNKVRYYADVTKMMYYAIPVVGFLLFVGLIAVYRDIVDPLNLG